MKGCRQGLETYFQSYRVYPLYANLRIRAFVWQELA